MASIGLAGSKGRQHNRPSPLPERPLGLPQVAPTVHSPNPSLLDQLHAVFGAAKESTQFYMDNFDLYLGERVLLDVPITVKGRSFFGLRMSSKARFGITDQRLLFPKDGKFKECLLPGVRGDRSTTLWGTICRGRPGTTGIEIEGHFYGDTWCAHIWRFYLESPDSRDALVEYIQSKFPKS